MLVLTILFVYCPHMTFFNMNGNPSKLLFVIIYAN